MDAQGTLNVILIVGVIVAGIGYAAGQFLTQRRKGASDALGVALDEIAALTVRADRLAADVRDLSAQLTAVRAENQTLRGLIVDLRGGTP